MIRLKPRLAEAASLLSDLPQQALIADIGCDHGQLICCLLSRNPSWRGIASDISRESLKKAERAAEESGVSERLVCAVGDGLETVRGLSPDAVFICGMGGETIAGILENGEIPTEHSPLFILQPMSGIEELRAYLYLNNFHVLQDRIVREGRKYYQVFSVRKQINRQEWPEVFPKDLYSVGYKAFQMRTPLLVDYVTELRDRYAVKAREAAGTDGEDGLLQKEQMLSRLLENYPDSF